METEKSLREYEELRTVDDYVNAYAVISEIASNFSGASQEVEDCFGEILLSLTKSFKKKCEYIDKKSRKWRRKQGIFSKFRDYLAERQEKKVLEQRLENERLQAKIRELMSQSQKSEEIKTEQQNISSPASEAVVLSEAEHKPIEVVNEDNESAVLDF